MLVSSHRNRCASRNHNQAPQIFLSLRIVIRHNFAVKLPHFIAPPSVGMFPRKLPTAISRLTASPFREWLLEMSSGWNVSSQRKLTLERASVGLELWMQIPCSV